MNKSERGLCYGLVRVGRIEAMGGFLTWMNGKPARRAGVAVGAPILGLLAVVIMLVAALLVNFARQQDASHAAATQRLVLNAITSRQAGLSDLILDYANWDAAYEAVSGERLDMAWLSENFYSSVADGVLILREGEIIYTWVDDPFADRAEALAQAALAAAAATPLEELAGAPVLGDGVLRTMTAIDGQLMLVAVAPITPEDDDARIALARSGRAVSFAASIQLIGREELAAMGETLELAEIEFQRDIAPSNGRLAAPLRSAAGDTIGALTWREARPGSAGFNQIAWLVVVIIALAGAIALMIARMLVTWQLKAIAGEEAALESSRHKSEFIASMSHELRTPLDAIIGYAELIQEDADETMKPDAARIIRAARHLMRLVSDILDQSKLEAGQLTLAPERLGIADVLDEVRELTEPLVRQSHSRLVIAPDDSASVIYADHVRVRQCLLNLVGNAAKFTKEGVITITARQQAAHDGALMVAIDVEDTGIGMAPHEVAKLFAPFSQANKDIQRTFGGMGLGLSISRKLARAMGGDIVVESEPGKGSTFTLLLPAAAAMQQAA